MMSNDQMIEEVLRQVAAGKLSPEAAQLKLAESKSVELGFATVDTDRTRRRGRPEAVFCEGKTVDHVLKIARALIENAQVTMMTRLSPEQFRAIQDEFGDKDLVVCEPARWACVFPQRPPVKEGIVGIVCAGTTDLPAAEEAAHTAEALGSRVERFYDVGVAGIHRLFKHQEEIAKARVLVVVAGMEGALPSVVAGLMKAPVIAVPTSVGYGASFNGVAALLGMLNSCSPGISVVNIDNGFGAGYLADSINEIGELKS